MSQFYVISRFYDAFAADQQYRKIEIWLYFHILIRKYLKNPSTLTFTINHRVYKEELSLNPISFNNQPLNLSKPKWKPFWSFCLSSDWFVLHSESIRNWLQRLEMVWRVRWRSGWIRMEWSKFANVIRRDLRIDLKEKVKITL